LREGSEEGRRKRPFYYLKTSKVVMKGKREERQQDSEEEGNTTRCAGHVLHRKGDPIQLQTKFAIRKGVNGPVTKEKIW